MNKKLIAVAVAGAVAAPAAYADITAYGRINNALVFKKDDMGDNTSNMSTNGSRFGFKGSGDIGNGMTAFARYEFSTNTDTAKAGDSGIGRRLGFVGLSGSFGSVSLGQQWSAYYQNFGTHMSLNIMQGPGQSLGPFRTGNTIQYANSFGPVSLKVDARVDDEMDGQGKGFGIGATINPMANVTLAGGYDTNEKDDEDTMGFVGSFGLGMFAITASYEQQEKMNDMKDKSTTVWVGAGLTDKLGMKVGFQQNKMADGSETDTLAVNGAYKLGGGLQLWGEFYNKDEGAMDSDVFSVGIRMDF